MNEETCECGGTIVGVEYAYGNKYRYDGISEKVCSSCERRWGRWCEQELTGSEVERPFCTGTGHPRVIDIEPSNGAEQHSTTRDE